MATTAGLELRDYLRILRRRKRIVAAVTLLVVAAALALSFLQDPLYEARADVLLQGRASESLYQASDDADPVRVMNTQIRIVKSPPIRERVREKLGYTARVAATAVASTDIMQVIGRHRDPERAAAIANAYANAYVEVRREETIEDLRAAGREIETTVSRLQREIDDLEEQLDAAPVCTSPSATPAACNQREAIEAATSSRREALVQQQGLFRQQLDELGVASALKRGGAQVVAPAAVPRSPVRPTPVRNGIVALGTGLLLGGVLAFLVDYLDDSIKAKDDVDRVAHGTPVLGMIPAVAAWRERDQAMVVSRVDPSSAAAEAYRSLRTAVQFTGLDRPMRTVQLTSPNAAEGKTTTIANLGVALARAGQRVVLVDCDLRRPRIHDFFRLTNDTGLTSVLLGESSLTRAIQEVPGEDRLKLVASGPIPPNPSELLGNRRTAELLAALQAESDVVLIDSPPVLPVTDAAVLSSRVDATLVVVTAGSTSRKALQRALELLRQVDAPVVGTIINGITEDAAYASGYEYGYQYVSREAAAGGAAAGDPTPRATRR